MQEIIIEAGRASRHYWRDVWQYRELFYFLAWRDILVRYKQTVVGLLWALLRPVLTVLVLTLVFGRLAKMPDHGTPYTLLVFSAMLPWTLFANAFSGGSSSLVGNANLISKVYFPRLIIPAGAVVVGFIDFLISLCLLFLLLAFYSIWPGWRLLALPPLTLLAMVTALGPALWIGALNVRYRDFNQVVPFVLQLGLYVSPVGFSSEVIPEKWRLLYSLNPMVGVIDGFRWVFLGNAFRIDQTAFFLSLTGVIVIFLTGIGYFRKTEKSFSDVI